MTGSQHKPIQEKTDAEVEADFWVANQMAAHEPGRTTFMEEQLNNELLRRAAEKQNSKGSTDS